MVFRRSTAVAALTLAAFSGQADADDNFWIAARAGTQGLGLEATWRAVPYLDLRLGLSRYDYSTDRTEAGIDYDVDLELDSLYATVNARVPLSPFRVTAGVVRNGNEGLFFAPQQASFDIGGQTFAGSSVGNLRGNATFDDLAPYAGVGFDFRVANSIGLHLDAGVMYQGEASVSLAADGTLAGDPTFQAALETERAELEDEISDYEWFPVVALAISFNF